MLSKSTHFHEFFNRKTSLYAELGMTHTARFYADKALLLSSNPPDVLRQARLHVSANQPRRALHLLNTSDLVHSDISARLLAAQCHFSLCELDQCLTVLGEGDAIKERDIYGALSDLDLQTKDKHCEVKAALCVLRARVYERMENPSRAIEWFKRALCFDLYCIDAFSSICDTGLLSRQDVAAFLIKLTAASAEDPDPSMRIWLTNYYLSCADRTAPLPDSPEGIIHNIDIRAIYARRKYEALDFVGCIKICRQIISDDPHVEENILVTYLAALVELEERHELFANAHTLVETQPRNAVSWLAVGYYYFSCGKPEVARRFLQKATSINPRLAPAWIAFGHAFGAQDESDQAMASYRTASLLFPGAQLPMLFMGMEYARQGSLNHASMLFQQALKACPSDPAPRHELGVIVYLMGDHARAAAYFKAALSLWDASDGTREVSSCRGQRAQAEEATLVNLGHCYRRLREFGRAKRCYERALGLRPRSAATCMALGMTLHSMCDIQGAVAMYHRALRNNADDADCTELLERALEDMFVGQVIGPGSALQEGASMAE